MTTDSTNIDAGANIEQLHADIEAMHAESMARLNRMAWQCEDLLTLCEVLAEEIAARQQQPVDKRAHMARTVLQGAANDTSRRLALRLVLPWYTQEVQTALDGQRVSG